VVKTGSGIILLPLANCDSRQSPGCKGGIRKTALLRMCGYCWNQCMDEALIPPGSSVMSRIQFMSYK